MCPVKKSRLCALLAVLPALPALAQPVDTPPPSEPTPPPVVTDPPEPEPAEDKKDKPEIDVGGRVFVRDTITKLKSDGAPVQNELSLESVRANIDLRAYGWLRAAIEVSLEEGGEIDLEDTFIRADLSDELRVDVGRFKRPMSPIALESAWSLPATERGILSDDVLVGDFSVPLNLGGRENGAMISYNGGQAVDPRLYVGVFDASLPDQAGGGPQIADLADNLLRDLYTRATIEPIGGFQVGGSFAVITRARTVSQLQSKYMGSLDLTIDTDVFRAWLEGFAGNTTLFDGVESVGTLLAFRVLLAPRFDDPIAPLSQVRRIEPFVIFSALDPTDARDNNRAIEVGGGVAIWFHKLLRFQADYTYNAYDDLFPSPMFSFIDRHTVRFQLGSQFR